MPGNTLGTADISVEIFGGLVTDMAPTDIPQGGSPDNQDVAFLVGEVHTRPGLQNLFAPFFGNPSINYLKTFSDLNLNNRLMILDSLGNLYQEFPAGVVNEIQGTLVGTAPIVPGSYGQSTTTFGREWMAFSDGKFGIDNPLQWDGTNLDRVSQVGPGAGPTAFDENVSGTLVASPNGIQVSPTNAIVSTAETGNIVTVVVTNPAVYLAGDPINIVGVGVAGYNQQAVILKVISSTSFTYVCQNSGLAASGGGTARLLYASLTFTGAVPTPSVGQTLTLSGVTNASWDVSLVVGRGPGINVIVTPTQAAFGNSGGGTVTWAGNIVAGVHQVVVFFVTRQGYYTHPSPPSSWTAAGGKRVILTNIPLGPSNVVARIVAFTTSGGDSFFYMGADPTLGFISTTISDNTTTAATFDFTDIILLNGTQIDAPGNNLFNLEELGEVSGFIDYASRLFAWGERNKVQNFLNLSFEGSDSFQATPPGWTTDPTNGAGGTVTTSPITSYLNYYQITGDGATPIRGMITQPAYQDYLGQPIILPNVQYSVRARIWQNLAVAQGVMHVDLFSPTAGLIATGLTVTFAQAGLYPVEFIAPITPVGGIVGAVPSDLVLRVYSASTQSNFSNFFIDSIEPFPTLNPYDSSGVRASLADKPEAFDGLTGIQQYGFNDGTRITTAFKIRDSLYFVKEHSLWVTKDDGTNEPDKWSVDKVADIGTPSVHGVGFGEDWVVIAGRSGVYFFDVGDPDKISQEIARPIFTPLNTILPGWDSIVWTYGHRLWCKVDRPRRRIMIGAPTGAATTPNVVFVLDYRSLDTGGELKSDTSVHISGYTGKILEIGNARKWTRWNMSINSCELIERNDSYAHTFMGNGTGTGKVYDLLEVQDFANPSQFSDDGVPINSYYDTYYFIRPDQEDILQMGSHRKLFYYLTAYIEGQGTPSYFAIPPGNAPPIPIPQSGSSAPKLRTSNGAFGIAITSVTRNGTVITVTTANPHGLTPSDNVVLSGVTDPSYNGLYGGVQIVNPNVFTVPNATLGGNSSGGFILPFTRDTELPVNVLTERVKLRIQTNAVGSWFSLRNLCLSMRADPWAPVRGGPS